MRINDAYLLKIQLPAGVTLWDKTIIPAVCSAEFEAPTAELYQATSSCKLPGALRLRSLVRLIIFNSELIIVSSEGTTFGILSTVRGCLSGSLEVEAIRKTAKAKMKDPLHISVSNNVVVSIMHLL